MRSPTTRHLVLGGASLVGAATAATSAVSLFQLAELCGIPAPLAAALPIALDAGAGVAALVWITERGELRTWGRGVAVAALVATLAGNGVQHAITSGLLTVTLPLVLAVGACIPAMLFACVHLAALMARPTTVERRTLKPRPGRATSPPSTPRPGPAPSAVALPTGKRAAGLTYARSNPAATAKQVQLAAGVSKGESYRILAAVKTEREAS